VQTEDDVTDWPCAEALLAGAVALMTTWADPCPNCTLGPTAQRRLVARKVVSNLYFLQQHPALGPELRGVMAQAHQRWVGVARAAAALEGSADAGPAPETAGRSALH
jgi:hypothetical protein